MVNLQLPISHIIITSKARSKVQMSSEASLGKKENNNTQDSQKIGSIHGPFMKGSVIQLGNGDMKNVEDLQTEDFERSAYSSANFVLEYSRLTRLGFGNLFDYEFYIKLFQSIVLAPASLSWASPMRREPPLLDQTPPCPQRRIIPSLCPARAGHHAPLRHP